MIAIIDYSMGNLRSVEKAFQKIGANVVITKDHDIIKRADKIVLPGVGAFKEGMENLKQFGLIALLNEQVLQNKKFFLGICLGMQLIGSRSYEVEETPGLNWIKGDVVKFNSGKLKVPHVGWNNIRFIKPNVLFKNIPDQTDFYFVHSYYFESGTQGATTVTDYGIDFVSSVNKDNIFGCQFHPEKSQKFGLEILKNFANLNR
ncbi:MAG: imidazole glycerol phosphate synthase subunit HisH [Proteobacteria bacterium]|nr:imidazole glycerol phosphate synthase subunit HisH [Pseudomonadota bacterium]MBU1388918.1 imidazole glycerol phosphate synthase subunit HisH [Pseudomonadota bacterium]MBU1543470.1 imidazole glycerol phosphate synthase subunit HisH [Pseudomonadota bacterium]MBU2430943.1 imidazole glycerol phosphate synthase subunit HisH [Pseudomonadota bacterium]MBU2480532.1 imidazole glycerol phosphate synthase subunit HisH [Pseudomonadota bacterium]